MWIAANITVVSDTSEPTDRSMPAVRITKVIPDARMALIAACRPMFRKFPTVRNTGERMVSSRPSSSSASNGASCSSTAFTRGRSCGCAAVRRSLRSNVYLPERQGQDALLGCFAARELADDPPATHHQDAVAHPQHLL